MAPMFDPSSILLLLVMVLSGGVRDLASCLSTDAYWKAKGVTVSIESLAHDLEAVKAADVSALIKEMDADDAKDRDAATERIASVGLAALPALEEAAKNGSPEVSARAKVLLERIRAAAKAGSIRRLMAIRTLGERKDAGAMALLRPLLESKEMFEADYARAAIAKIEGKDYSTPAATDAQRAADVALLPARLDVIAQMAPTFEKEFLLDKMLLDAIPMDQNQRNTAHTEAVQGILKVLETVGNIRLYTLTWGFYAAPPGVPGNSILMARTSST